MRHSGLSAPKTTINPLDPSFFPLPFFKNISVIYMYIECLIFIYTNKFLVKGVSDKNS